MHVRRGLRVLPKLRSDAASWGRQSLADLGEEGFSDAMLRASVGDPFSESTPKTALADLRELIDAAGPAFDPHGWFVVGDVRGDIGVVLPHLFADRRTTGTLWYLGVLPERRGHGYGTQLHLLGLHRLRSLGALDYVGSTDTANEPMLRVFARNGCVS